MADRPNSMTLEPDAAEAPPRRGWHWFLVSLAVLNFLGLLAALLVFVSGLPFLSAGQTLPLSAAYPCLFALGMAIAWSGRSRPDIEIDDVSAGNRTATAVFSIGLFAAGIYVGMQFLDEVGAVLNDTVFQAEPHTVPVDPPVGSGGGISD